MPILGEKGHEVTLLGFERWSSCPEKGRVAEFSAIATGEGFRGAKLDSTGMVVMSPRALKKLLDDEMEGLLDTEVSVLEYAALS